MESSKQKNDSIVKTLKEKFGVVFLISMSSGLVAIISGILVIVSNLSILTFNSQGVLNELNSTSALNSSTAAYINLTFNGISSVKNGIIVLGPLLIIAGIFMIVSAFYLKSKDSENRHFGVFLTFLFSIFAVLGLLIYIPFNSLAVLILVYLPLTTFGAVAYALMVVYIVLGLIAGALALVKNKRYLS